MSSHHIIRDEQEPPVLVFQLNENWEQLSEILGWSPILLIDPVLRETFESRQTKIDGYVIEEKSGSNTNIGEKDLVYNDFHIVESLLNWLKNKKCTALNIFCNRAIMMDLFEKIKNKSLSIPFIFFTDEGKYILKPSSKFKKWYPEKFIIDIINDEITSTENLVQIEEGFSVEKTGFVRVEVKGELILIKEK